MRIDSLIVCTRITPTGGALTIEGVGIDTFVFSEFPATAQFAVLVRAIGPHDTAEHHFLVRVTDANREMQSESIIPVTMGKRPPDLPRGWPVRTLATLAMEVTFAEPGVYGLSAGIDNSFVRDTHPLFARLT